MNRPGTSEWDIASATALGAGHTRTGQPNQDAHQCAQLAGDQVLVAVADGHGGKGYVRSDIGSRSAVAIAIDVLSELVVGAQLRAETADPSGLGSRTAPPVEVRPDSAELAMVPRRIVERWRAHVIEHLQADPLSAQERATATPATLADPFQLYGCTLLLAWLGPHGLWSAQIGDGDIVALVDGRCVSPVPEDSRLIGNLTTSLCAARAAEDFRSGVIPDLAPGDLVLLATDGYGNSFASGDWADEVLPDLAQGIDRHGMAQVREELPSWVAQSAAIGGDDTTVVVVRRRGRAGTGWVEDDTAVQTVVRAPDVEEPVVPLTRTHPSPTGGGARRPGMRRRAAYALVAGAVGIAGVGYAATRLLGGGEPTSGASATSSSPVTPSSSSSTQTSAPVDVVMPCALVVNRLVADAALVQVDAAGLPLAAADRWRRWVLQAPSLFVADPRVLPQVVAHRLLVTSETAWWPIWTSTRAPVQCGGSIPGRPPR
ncbi:MAG: PP2C family serine/threonine-protein phosphatase [Dermatophilaceae bacterium]